MPKQRKKQSKAAKNLLESLENTFTDRSGAGSVDDLFDIYETELAKQPKLAKQAELTKQVNIAKQPKLAKHVRLAKQPELAKQVELTKQSELAKQVELAKQAKSDERELYGNTRRIVEKWIDYIKKKEVRILILISVSKFIRNSRWKTDYIKTTDIVNEIFNAMPDRSGSKSYSSYIRSELATIRKDGLIVSVDRLPEGYNTKYLVRLPFNINNKIHPKNMSTRRLLVNYLMVDSFLPKIQSDSELLIQFLEYRNNILLELKNRGLKP